jgi:FixJ family two-component response regulator
MPKALLVSVVEDDQFFRESMKRLMRSLGYSVEAFPSAPISLRPLALSKPLAWSWTSTCPR